MNHDDAARTRLARLTEQFSPVAELVGLGIFTRDLRTGVGEWNTQLFKLYGFDPAQPVPTRDELLARIHVDDRERFQRAWFDADPQTEPQRMLEFRIRRADGIVHVLTRGVVQRGADGVPVRLLGVAIDFTAQRQAQQQARLAQRELQETLQRLELATSGSALGIFERELDRDRAYWSREQYALWGEPIDAPPADWRRMNELVHPDDRAVFEAGWEKLRQATSFVQSEFRIRRRDGAERWLMTRGKLDRAANRVVGITLDITEARRAQQEHAALVERFDLIGESMGLGLWEYDAATRAFIWNEQMYALVGCSRATLGGRKWLDFVHPADAADAVRVWETSLARRESFEHEYRVVRADGSIRWLASRGRVVRDADGRARRVFGIEWDVTEQKDAHAALLAKETAERASAAKSAFLSRMSHELRTPLNAILGFAQILGFERPPALTAVQRGYVAQIEAAGWHLLTLINEVLDLSRIESGATPVELQPTDLAPLIDECVALSRPEADRRSIRIESSAAPDAPAQARADPTRLKQTLLNLLSNAVKYNRDGGQVTIRVDRADGERVAIRVRDTGRGMTASQLESLFQPFNRLGMETSPIEGTGIGLTISRRLVELMDGTLGVTSQPDAGSEFTIELPAASD